MKPAPPVTNNIDARPRPAGAPLPLPHPHDRRNMAARWRRTAAPMAELDTAGPYGYGTGSAAQV
jgi:hypothetical protein